MAGMAAAITAAVAVAATVTTTAVTESKKADARKEATMKSAMVQYADGMARYMEETFGPIMKSLQEFDSILEQIPSISASLFQQSSEQQE